MIIGFPHPPPVHGGPGSFQTRFENELRKQDWQIVYPDDDVLPDVILVVGGTKKLKWLRQCKKQGTRIVHRLDGLNWQHKMLKTPLKNKIMATIRNWIFKRIRNKLADHVIYQSEFIKECWYKYSGPSGVTETVINNAVDLNSFSPLNNSSGKPKLVCIEGAIHPHEAYVAPLKHLAENLYEKGVIALTSVCGHVEESFKEDLENYESIVLHGSVSREEIPAILHNSVYLALEVHPPCPNSVIEALASGVPVIGYDTGSLKELVGDEAGFIVPYGSNPWKLEMPDLDTLLVAAEKVFSNYEEYAVAARKRAVEKFDILDMTAKYQALLLVGN